MGIRKYWGIIHYFQGRYVFNSGHRYSAENHVGRNLFKTDDHDMDASYSIDKRFATLLENV